MGLVVKCSYCKTSDYELLENVTTFGYHYGVCVECFRKVFNKVWNELGDKKVGKKVKK